MHQPLQPLLSQQFFRSSFSIRSTSTSLFATSKRHQSNDAASKQTKRNPIQKETSNATVEISPRPDVAIVPLGINFQQQPQDAGAHSFLLDPRLQRVLRRHNWTQPTPIQAHGIPLVLSLDKRDVLAASPTGSGKTLFFSLPLVQRLLNNRNHNRHGAEALIVSPTRELAAQTARVLQTLCQDTALTVALATGGSATSQQRRRVPSSPIVVGTPGRLLQFADEGHLQFSHLNMLVLDEADRLLDLGFGPQLTRLAQQIQRHQRRTNGQRHQSILCSATFPPGVQRLATEFLRPQYSFLSASSTGQAEQNRVGAIPKAVQQRFDFLNDNKKGNGRRGHSNQQQQQKIEAWVVSQVRDFFQKQQPPRQKHKNRRRSVLVFCNTKDGAERHGQALQNAGFAKTRVLHGDKVQAQRTRILNEFASSGGGNHNILVATDVAARGLDVPHIGLVVQPEAPRDLDTYTHRVGRTGRAGATGQAVTCFASGLYRPGDQRLALGLLEQLNHDHDDNETPRYPAWLQGMAHVARARQQEEQDQLFVEEEETGADPVGDGTSVNEEYSQQDFRRRALDGSYGMDRDASYRSFEDEAYGTVATTVEAEEDDWLGNGGVDENKDEDDVLTLDDGDVDGTLYADPEKTDDDNREGQTWEEESVLSESTFLEEEKESKESNKKDDEPTKWPAAYPFHRTAPPSRALQSRIAKITGERQDHVSDTVNEAVLNVLSHRSRRGGQSSSSSDDTLWFEYLGLFPYEQVSEHLMATSASSSQQDNSSEELPQILMVAEKPSIAKAIAEALSGRKGARQKRGISPALPVYQFVTREFEPLRNQPCRVSVTSVVGHIFSLGFDRHEESQEDEEEEDGNKRQNNHRRTHRDPRDHFHLPVVKQEADNVSKLRVLDHLRALAKPSDHLVLWLDCDPEGENICHEVMAVTKRALEENQAQDQPTHERQVHRARFSAITLQALQDAFANLVEPDAALSRSVDARQELDLRVGVALTRLLTWKCVGSARQRFDPSTRLVSYGPCQTPALSFCADRARDIESHEPEPYWQVDIQARLPGGKKTTLVPLQWQVPKTAGVPDVRDGRSLFSKTEEGDGSENGNAVDAMPSVMIDNATFQKSVADRLVGAANRSGAAVVVTHVEEESVTKPAPVGLNTVALLEAGSKAMGMSPKSVMKTAEQLYSAGFISYPRTETTRYDPTGWNVRSTLKAYLRHEVWGKPAGYLLRTKYSKSGRPPPRGRDAGDHPPITPLKVATRQDVGGGAAWRVYEFVVQNFLGSLHNDLTYTRGLVHLELSGEKDGKTTEFTIPQVSVQSLGFADVCRWVLKDIGAYQSGGHQQNKQDWAVSTSLAVGQVLPIAQASIQQHSTRPPRFLQEYELIRLMDAHRIGTDASMAVHVNNLVDRRYVVLVDETGEPLRPPRPPGARGPPRPRQVGRYLVPTALGMGLLDLFGNGNSDDTLTTSNTQLLAQPAIRRQMEEQVHQIATGALDKETCLETNLEWFEQRYGELEATLLFGGRGQDKNARNRVSSSLGRFTQSLRPTQQTLQYYRDLGAFEERVNVQQHQGTGGRRRSKHDSDRVSARKPKRGNNGNNNRKQPPRGKRKTSASSSTTSSSRATHNKARQSVAQR